MKQKLLVALIAIFAVISMSSCSLKRIDNGNTGIKVKLAGSERGTQNITTVTGWNFYWLWQYEIHEWPSYVLNKDYEPFTILTKDASSFSIDPKLNYSIPRSSAVHIFNKYRKDPAELETTVLRNAVYDACRLAANEYTADGLMANRASFEAKVQARLTNFMAKDGFKYENLTMNILPPQSLRDAIDAKNKAVQDALKAENEVKTADAQAKIAIAVAKGEADAKRIVADGEAYYNQKVGNSISANLVRLRLAEKWDGKQPVISGQNGMILNVGKEMLGN